MSHPPTPATISLPLNLINAQVRELLNDYGAEDEDFQPGEHLYADLEITVDKGIFSLHDSQAAYGEFWELEELLKESGIPFDRESSMDWNRPPGLRIFRPGLMDKWIDLDEYGYPVVQVNQIRKFLVIEATGEPLRSSYALACWLDEQFNYPPLSLTVWQDYFRGALERWDGEA